MLILTALLFNFSEVQANVKKKIEADGTLTFYYTAPKKSTPRTAARANTNLSSRFDELIEKIAAEEGIDSRLVKCIIKAESDFQPNAVSPAGAMGLMQLMKATADIYNVSDPFDPEENVRAGVKHFKYLLKELKNDIPLSLAAYNAGLGAVRRQNGIPRIRETMNYVNRVMTLYSGPTGLAGVENSNQVEQASQAKPKPIKRRVDKDGDLIFSN